jgi:hypothetical protein
MTDDNIVDTRWGLPPLHRCKPSKERNHPVGMLLALKLLLTIHLVTLGGCVNTKPGDTNAPEARPF